jgi:hypothetical protein
MSETFERIGAWIKSHPIPSLIIALVIVVAGVYLYKHSGGASITTANATGSGDYSDVSGGSSGAGGAAQETLNPLDNTIVYPSISTMDATPTYTPIGNYAQTPGAITAPLQVASAPTPPKESGTNKEVAPKEGGSTSPKEGGSTLPKPGTPILKEPPKGAPSPKESPKPSGSGKEGGINIPAPFSPATTYPATKAA